MMWWSVKKELYYLKTDSLGIAPSEEEKEMVRHATSPNANMHQNSSNPEHDNSKSLLRQVHSNNTQNLVENKTKAAPIALPNILLIGAQKGMTGYYEQ